jgi:glutamyl-tRNA synthetase
MPHVGTAYIALFNYCFAKSQGGQFILRIEDADQTRSRREHETTILEALSWCGLTWDEGPDVGGPHGPYRQSERTEIYRKYAQQLLDSGHAYKCYCTPERLEALREQQKRDGGQLGYDGHCLGLSEEEGQKNDAQNLPFTVRLKVPESGSCNLHDPLRGDITFDYGTIDHQILIKSDGFPTYHLANVVDDHLMGITHVIRGEEWLPSLPKHILLYEYFDWEVPTVIHLPLLRNQDKSKLSKRKNPTSILYYKEQGILPEALLNFLGQMAYSMPEDREVFQLDEMVEAFNIDRISLGGPIFEQDKLRWLNQQHIAALSPDALLDRLKTWRFNDAFLSKLIPMMQPRLHKLGDFMQVADFMFYSDVAPEREALIPKKSTDEDTRDFLQKLVWELEPLVDFSKEVIEAAVRKAGDIHGWKVRDAAHATRVAICGKTVAPPLFDVMAILGSDVCRNRINDAVKQLGELGKKKLGKMQKEYQVAAAAYVAEAQAE